MMFLNHPVCFLNLRFRTKKRNKILRKLKYIKYSVVWANIKLFIKSWSLMQVTQKIISVLNFRYIASGQFFVNGYLKSQGFPKSTFFDPKKPVDSISAFVNYVAKKYFEFKIQSREYVQPIVEYAQVCIWGAIKK